MKLEDKKKAEEEEKKVEVPLVPKKKFETTKESADSTNDSTLFVRNIAWDVT